MTKNDHLLLAMYSGGSAMLSWFGDLAQSADVAWLFIQKWGSAALFLLAIYKAFWPIIRPTLVEWGWKKPRRKSQHRDECDCEDQK